MNTITFNNPLAVLSNNSELNSSNINDITFFLDNAQKGFNKFKAIKVEQEKIDDELTKKIAEIKIQENQPLADCWDVATSCSYTRLRKCTCPISGGEGSGVGVFLLLGTAIIVTCFLPATCIRASIPNPRKPTIDLKQRISKLESRRSELNLILFLDYPLRLLGPFWYNKEFLFTANEAWNTWNHRIKKEHIEIRISSDFNHKEFFSIMISKEFSSHIRFHLISCVIKVNALADIVKEYLSDDNPRPGVGYD